MSNPKSRKRIALFATDDLVWVLPTLKETIPVLLEKHDVIGIYLFPERLGKNQGIKTYLWYLQVFGLWDFLVMSLYAIKKRWMLLLSPIRNWIQLSYTYGLVLLRANTPNSKEVIKWTKENEIDIVIIMIDHILKEEIIQSPKIGIINKHAAMLPSCKGIFPFFWAKLTDAPTGITFHEVDTGIDTGRILVQVEYPSRDVDISMLRFYIDVYAVFPRLALLAVDNSIAQVYAEPLPNIKSNYFSLPQKSDYIAYREKSFKIGSLSDLLYQPTLSVKNVHKEINISDIGILPEQPESMNRLKTFCIILLSLGTDVIQAGDFAGLFLI